MIGIAILYEIVPVSDRACKIPTDAADDCITPVNTAPSRTLRSGFLNATRSLLKPSVYARGDTASFISSMPNISTAKPTMIVPMS